MLLKNQSKHLVRRLLETEDPKERKAILETLQDSSMPPETRTACKHIILRDFAAWLKEQDMDLDVECCHEYLTYLLAGDYTVDPAWASHETTEPLSGVVSALNTGAAMTAALCTEEVTDLWEIHSKTLERCLYTNPFLTEYTMFQLVVRILDALNEETAELPIPLECALRLYLVWGMGGQLATDNAVAWVLGEHFV